MPVHCGTTVHITCVPPLLLYTMLQILSVAETPSIGFRDGLA